MRESTRSVSQPEKIVPTMSNRPTSASSPAAVVVGMPWSCAAGMKCVPTSPFVDAPQIAKPPASNQNAPGAGGEAQRVDGLPCGAAGAGTVGVTTSVGAVQRQSEVGGVLAQEDQHEGYDGKRAAGDDQRRRSPAVVLGQPGDQPAGRPADRWRRPR